MLLLANAHDPLDEIIKILPSDLGSNTFWSIQTIGPHCILSPIHLEAQGLYVYKHRHSFNVPSLNSCLDDFTASLEWLMTMRNQMLQLEKMIQKYSIKKHSNDSTFNRKGKYVPNRKLLYNRDTYYTPPKNEQSKLPVFIYDTSLPEDISERDDVDQEQTTQLNNTGSLDESNFITEADKYGYRTYFVDGLYYNIYIKTFYIILIVVVEV